MAVGRVVGVVVALLGALNLMAAPASGRTATQPCEVGRAVVDVTYRFVNEQDLASNGEVWALAAAVSRFRLYRTGADTFCAAISLAGTFEAFGGPSPAGTGEVPAGVAGRFAGIDSLRLIGTFAPTLPTHGFVGTFDAQCDRLDCQNPIRFARNYVDVAGPPVHDTYRFAYVSTCGVWVTTNEGDIGDIAC
ncbi:MAG: hypothetical protein QOJ19_4304 [Acidimicrobiia bacterium]|jgi:hypothetical protein|nr:hypothetical protein [Acidimicrobiia bacterium]